MDTVGSRDLAREVALRNWQKAEDFPRFMPITQHWIRSDLFTAAGAAAGEQNPRRGKSRRFPVEALKWVRLFATLAGRGIATAEIEYVASILNKRFRAAVDDALAGRGEDVWLVYGSAPPLVNVEGLHIQRGSVRLPDYGDAAAPAVATCINLTQAFNPQ